MADVDGDGHAEIVVCSDNVRGSGTLADTGIYVLEDAADRWVRARRIWNQHSYHVTNVSEIGIIPRVEKHTWLVPRLNNFRQQAFDLEDADQADTFTYKVNDGQVNSNNATVHIKLQPANSAPEISSAPVTIATVGFRYLY